MCEPHMPTFHARSNKKVCNISSAAIHHHLMEMLHTFWSLLIGVVSMWGSHIHFQSLPNLSMGAQAYCAGNVMKSWGKGEG